MRVLMKFVPTIQILGLVLLASLAGQGTRAVAQPVDSAALLQPGPLPDMVLGAEDAPVTIVEYASMTCPHCRDFHVNTFEDLRAKYVDSGQVRFIFREFPLDIRAVLGSMLARCAPPEQFFDIVQVLFERQADWAPVEDPVLATYNLVSQAGFSEESFQACIRDQELYAKIVQVQEGGQRFGVDATPTFFVNGEQVRGGRSLEEFDEIIASHLR